MEFKLLWRLQGDMCKVSTKRKLEPIFWKNSHGILKGSGEIEAWAEGTRGRQTTASVLGQKHARGELWGSSMLQSRAGEAVQQVLSIPGQ